MKKTRIAINGFGRIGRYLCKLLVRQEDFEVVAINDLADSHAIAHLLKYDSVHGSFTEKVSLENQTLLIGDSPTNLYQIKKPEDLPWSNLDIDIVFECTGRFTSRENASKHLSAGAKKVIISAPTQDSSVPMVVLGVNDQVLKESDRIISNASCTTNCLAPMVKVLEEAFGIEKGYASTVHSYTNDQNLHDAPHRDLRRARAAAYSIIPTTTNAGKALDVVMPEQAGKIEASAMRVPVPDGSLTDMIVELKSTPTSEEINSAFKAASETSLNGFLEVNHDPIVSMDILGNTHSCIIDAELTSIKGNMAKIVGWYDNEAGYSNRLVDLAKKIS